MRKNVTFSGAMKNRLKWIFYLVLLAMFALMLWLARIVIRSGDKYTKTVLSQRNYDSRSIPSRRGEIQDSNGNVLATSEKVYNLILDCYVINSGSQLVKKGATNPYYSPSVNALVDVFDLDQKDIEHLLDDEETKKSRYQILLRKVTSEQKEDFEDYCTVKKGDKEEDITRKNNIQGIWFEETYDRKYPLESVASNTVGFIDNEGNGSTGLEKYYNDILNGQNGREFGYLNENSVAEKTIIPATNGNTLVTTLDVNIQQIVEKNIEIFDEEYGGGPNTTISGHGGKNVAVIVANPNNGEILAMAMNHSYNLNDPQDLSSWYTLEEQAVLQSNMAARNEDGSKKEGYADLTDTVDALTTMWRNFCVSYSFEPGSVVKPIHVAAALDSGAIDDDITFTCPGYKFVTDTQINCDLLSGHGEEDLSHVIQESCNVGLMEIAEKMGEDAFLYYERLFRFGKKTGIDLPDEASGIIYDEEGMNEVELATSSFGQGYTCTMIQELAAFCSGINGGNYYEPHLEKEIQDENGNVLSTYSTALLNQTISAQTSEKILSFLSAVVSDGTGKSALVPGYRIGGKTGTAEKLPRSDKKYLVSFIGAVPIDNPQVVIYTVVDEPNVEDQAHSTYAQILFRRIATEVLPYLGIYPTEEVSQQQYFYLGLNPDGTETVEIKRNLEGRVNEDGEEEQTVIKTYTVPAAPEVSAIHVADSIREEEQQE